MKTRDISQTSGSITPKVGPYNDDRIIKQIVQYEIKRTIDLLSIFIFN